MAVVVPDIPDLFEEAYQRAGLELRTGNDLRNASKEFFSLEAGVQKYLKVYESIFSLEN